MPAPLTPERALALAADLRSDEPKRIMDAQRALGVPADAIPGPITWAAHAALSAPARPALEPDTLARVLTASGVRQDRARLYARDVLAAMERYAINTPLRVGHFLAQLLVESGGLKYAEEIASGAAYEGRRDLGNTHAGDGRRFKGRGFIQVTGRANYKRYADHLRARGDAGWDVVSHPARVAEAYPADSAGYWWANNRANDVADGGDDVRDVQRVSRLVNRGSASSTKKANHEAERIDAFVKVAAALRREGYWNG